MPKTSARPETTFRHTAPTLLAAICSSSRDNGGSTLDPRRTSATSHANGLADDFPTHHAPALTALSNYSVHQLFDYQLFCIFNQKAKFFFGFLSKINFELQNHAKLKLKCKFRGETTWVNDKREKVEQLMEIFTILNGHREIFIFIHEIKTQACCFLLITFGFLFRGAAWYRFSLCAP